VLCLDQHMQA